MNPLPSSSRRLGQLSLLLVAVTLTLYPAQQPLSPDRITFYTEPNFKGEALTVEAGASVDNLDRMKRANQTPWSYAISSVRVEGTARAIVYSERNFQGDQLELNASDPDLFIDPRGQTPGATWDRSIASLAVVGSATVVVAPQPGPNQPPPATVVVVPAPVVQEVRPIYNARAAEAVIQKAYREVLTRAADPEGLRNYREKLLRDGWTERQVVEALQRSQEARSINPEEAITRAFREVLHRDPDPNGMNHYRQLWKDGWTQGRIRDDLGRSPEGRNVTIQTTINKAYRDLLGRDPDPSGYATYEKLMREKDWDERQVREALMSGDEYRQRRGKR